MIKIKLKSTYTINSIDKRIVATVAHSKPMATKKYDVDVAISEKKRKEKNNEQHIIQDLRGIVHQ